MADAGRQNLPAFGDRGGSCCLVWGLQMATFGLQSSTAAPALSERCGTIICWPSFPPQDNC